MSDGDSAVVSSPLSEDSLRIFVKPDSPPARHAPEAARRLVYLVALGLVAAAAWHYANGVYLGHPYPRNTFLFRPDDRFRDLYNLLPSVKSGDPYSQVLNVYFPFTYVVLYPFAMLSQTGSLLLFVAALTVGVLAFVYAHLDFLTGPERLGCTVVLVLSSYPFLFSLDRANTEGFVVLSMCVFAFALQRGKTGLAVAGLAAATALKAYPVVFVVIFIARRQWRAAAAALGLTALLSLLGTVYYGFDVFRVAGLLSPILSRYKEVYVIGDSGLAFGSSLFGVVKLIRVDLLGGATPDVRALLVPYAAVAGGLLLALAVYLVRVPLPLWKQMTLLTCATIVLPHASSDYKLLHLIIPAALFLRDGSDDRRRNALLVVFGLLLVPKAYLWLRAEVNIGVVLNPLLMVLLSVLVISSGHAADDSAISKQPIL